MKILYLGTFIEPDVFERLSEEGKVKSNPSGQNYHSLLAKAFGLENELTVLSMTNGPVGYKSAAYRYLGRPESRIKRYLSPKQRADAIASEFNPKECVVLFDGLSVISAKTAYFLQKSHHFRIVSVMTDRAENLSVKPVGYVYTVNRYQSICDGYITVTQALNDLYNVRRKPNMVVKGIVDPKPEGESRFEKGSYSFFGGALYERFGVKDLIDAYMAVPSAHNLVVVGHGELADYIKEASQKDKRIVFLGQVSPKEFHSLASNSALNINPRPYEPKLDPYCIPSKLFEYLTIDVPILSGPCYPLSEGHEEDVNWLPKVDVASLTDFFKTHTGEDGKPKGLVQNKNASKTKKESSPDSLKGPISQFLENFESSSSK